MGTFPFIGLTKHQCTKIVLLETNVSPALYVVHFHAGRVNFSIYLARTPLCKQWGTIHNTPLRKKQGPQGNGTVHVQWSGSPLPKLEYIASVPHNYNRTDLFNNCATTFTSWRFFLWTFIVKHKSYIFWSVRIIWIFHRVKECNVDLYVILGSIALWWCPTVHVLNYSTFKHLAEWRSKRIFNKHMDI